MKKYFSKEQLIYALLVVSIITIVIIGIQAFEGLADGLVGNVSTAAKSVIIPFSLAFFLSFIINPLAVLLERKTFLNRTLSIIIAIAIGIIFIVTILGLTVSFIVIQLTSIISGLIENVDQTTISAFLNSVLDFINQITQPEAIESFFNEFNFSEFSFSEIGGFISSFFVGAANISSSAFHLVFTVILTPVFMYYLIKDRYLIFNSIANAFPKGINKHLKVLGPETDKVIRGYFLGHGLVMIFITVFFMITYSIMAIFIPNFNIFYALLFALVMGIFSILPYLGVWISMSMPIVMFLTLHLEHGDSTYIYLVGIALIFILNIVEEILESSLVQPNVFSKQVHIHPLAVLSSFIFFGGVFGLVGFILAVPIAGMIKVTFRYFIKLNKEKGSTTS